MKNKGRPPQHTSGQWRLRSDLLSLVFYAQSIFFSNEDHVDRESNLLSIRD